MADEYNIENSREFSYNKKPKLWFWILGVIVGILLISLYLFFLTDFFSGKISEDELSQGTLISLSEGKEIEFEINEEQHKIIVNYIYNDSVDIIIQSRVINANLKIGENKKFDLNDDGNYDIQVKLESIEDGKPNIFIKKISEVICIENWDCSGWSNCINDVQTRICNDLNNCETANEKPFESQDCEGNITKGENETLTCSEKSGTICSQTEICSGNLVDTSDTDKCCVGNCVFNETVDSDYNLQLSITTSKDTYEVGEVVSGDYHMSYIGDSFVGIVLYTFSREGCSEDNYARSRGTISTGSFEDNLAIHKTAFKAFKYNKVGSLGSHCSYAAGTDYFFEEGTYTYKLSVYDCSVVENELGISCSDAEPSRVAELIPMKLALKSVVVEGGVSSSECKTNSDCTKSCEGCDDGTQICRLPLEVCSDCINNFSCTEGYKCENYTCVLE